MNPPNDSVFALLVHKVAPFQFDIGFKVSSASIRDQVVRAQMVVRALTEAGLTRTDSAPMLICGAGVAGLAAAMEAEALGLPFVLIEKNDRPGGVLQGKGKRYISPTMYEWPATSVNLHSFPMTKGLAILGTTTSSPTSDFSYTFSEPATIADFVAAVLNVARPKLVLWRLQDKYFPNTTISDESKEQLQKMLAPGAECRQLPPLSFAAPKNNLPEQFSALLFTAGMAPETPHLKWKRHNTDREHIFDSETPGFWEKDRLLDANLGTAVPQPDVLVIGGGDGAIQDALRCLVDHAKAVNTLEIWEKIADTLTPLMGPMPKLRWYTVDDILLDILTLEGYTATGAMWVANAQIYKDLDQEYKLLAINLLVLYPNVASVIKAMLRSDVGSVSLSTRGGFSKCYALNRFLIHLIDQALLMVDPGRLQLVEEIKTFESVSVGKQMSGTVYVAGKHQHFNLIVSRVGSPGVSYQAIGLSGIKPERVEFGRIPVPLMAPPYKS